MFFSSFFFFFLLGWGEVLDYFLFQLLSELCFPTCTWSLAFSKVCFKFSDQASMNSQYPHVASVRLSSLFPYTAITEIRDASTVALCYTRSPMNLSQSQPPIVSHQTVGSPDTSTLWHTDRYPHSRTTINTPSFPEQSYIGMPPPPPDFIPLLPTLAQFSNVVCQVVRLSP